jgi:hypothetical protein
VESILNSTKKILGLTESYTAFDLDIITHINAAFSHLDQLGVGEDGGYFITDADQTWEQFVVPENQKNLVKSYIFLKVKMAFDPPATSFHVTALKEQIEQFEWRLNLSREVLMPPVTVPPEEDE